MAEGEMALTSPMSTSHIYTGAILTENNWRQAERHLYNQTFKKYAQSQVGREEKQSC